MRAAVPACAAVGRSTVGPVRLSVGWSGPQDMGVSVAKQMAGLLASIRTLPVLLTQPNGSAATVPAQSTRLASRRFWANVDPPLLGSVCSHPDCRQCRPRAAPPTAVTVQLLTPSERVNVPVRRVSYRLGVALPRYRQATAACELTPPESRSYPPGRSDRIGGSPGQTIAVLPSRAPSALTTSTSVWRSPGVSLIVRGSVGAVEGYQRHRSVSCT